MKYRLPNSCSSTPWLRCNQAKFSHCGNTATQNVFQEVVGCPCIATTARWRQHGRKCLCLHQAEMTLGKTFRPLQRRSVKFVVRLRQGRSKFRAIKGRFGPLHEQRIILKYLNIMAHPPSTPMLWTEYSRYFMAPSTSCQ